VAPVFTGITPGRMARRRGGSSAWWPNRVGPLPGDMASVHACLLPCARVAGLLGQAGLDTHAQLLREPYKRLENDQRAYLFARRPTSTSQ
jgi:hypothetical protein